MVEEKRLRAERGPEKEDANEVLTDPNIIIDVYSEENANRTVSVQHPIPSAWVGAIVCLT